MAAVHAGGGRGKKRTQRRSILHCDGGRLLEKKIIIIPRRSASYQTCACSVRDRQSPCQRAPSVSVRPAPPSNLPRAVVIGLESLGCLFAFGVECGVAPFPYRRSRVCPVRVFQVPRGRIDSCCSFGSSQTLLCRSPARSTGSRLFLLSHGPTPSHPISPGECHRQRCLTHSTRNGKHGNGLV